MTLAEYADRFAKLRCGKVGEHRRPHKPVMMLAILDLMESGQVAENQIPYSPELLELFKKYFKVVKEGDDSVTPLLPFWHLKGDKFFHHKVQKGCEKAYEVMDHPKGARKLGEVVEYAFLDDELFALLSKADVRQELREVLIGTYFSRCHEELIEVIHEEQDIGAYEKALQDQVTGDSSDRPEASESVRNVAFGRAVRKAYDYRCAACGLRVILEDGAAIVDAAHLVPFAETHDDDPRNGMALCKNHHWAMDRFLLVPAPDLKWHVSKALDDRIDGQRDLLELNKRKILLPGDERYCPKKDALQWRKERIAKVG